MSARDKANRVLIHVILILVSITMLVPFLWMILTAFKTMTEATSVNPFVILPSTWRWDSFREVSANMDFLHLYINTLLLILGRVVCAVLTATLAGYAFGRLNFRGKPDVLSGPFPDDGSWTDFHYPTVLNGKQNGNAQYHFCLGISRYCYCIWYIPPQTGLYGTSKRSGRGCTS